MREMTVGNDAEFSFERFESRYRADLGNDLGNLVSRLLHMTAAYEGGIVPAVELEDEPEKDPRALATNQRVRLGLFFRLSVQSSLDKTFAFIRGINKYADERTPWKLAKSEEAEDRRALRTCLGVMIESLRLASGLLAAVMPGVHEKINDRLGLAPCALWEEDLVSDDRLAGKKLGEKTILFPRSLASGQGFLSLLGSRLLLRQGCLCREDAGIVCFENSDFQMLKSHGFSFFRNSAKFAGDEPPEARELFLVSVFIQLELVGQLVNRR